MSESLRRAGDVIIGEITIVSNNGMKLDVSPQLMSIEITENLFEPFTSGTVTINDSQNLSNLFPLVGNEFIIISFHTPSCDPQCEYKKSFFIYAISDKIKLTERSSGYQLRIISLDAVKDRMIRVSRTFRGYPHEIVQSLVGEYGLGSDMTLFAEQSTNQLVFISNMWKPSKCIDYACRHALNPDGQPTFMFFEQRNRYLFVTLDQLYQLPSSTKFSVNDWAKQPTTENDNTSTAMDINHEYQSIKRLQYSTGFNHFKRIDSGYYGSQTVGVDITTQQYVRINNISDFSKGQHLNKYSPIPDSVPVLPSSYIHYVPYVTQNFEGQNQGIQDTDFPYRGIRQQLISRLQATHLTAQVWGRSEYTVGMTVDISIPKDQQITKQDDPEDKLLSGKYLVTSLKHIITPVQHVCNLQVMKESYTTDLNYSALVDKPSKAGPEVLTTVNPTDCEVPRC